MKKIFATLKNIVLLLLFFALYIGMYYLADLNTVFIITNNCIIVGIAIALIFTPKENIFRKTVLFLGLLPAVWSWIYNLQDNFWLSLAVIAIAIVVGIIIFIIGIYLYLKEEEKKQYIPDYY